MLRLMIAASAALTLSAGFASAQTNSPPAAMSQTYTWPAELVSFVEATKTVSVKALVVGRNRASELKPLKAGDRVILGWSGFNDYSDAILTVQRADAAKPGDRFSLPAEFESADAKTDYITFKLRVPDASVATLKSLKPGEWVRVTSPHRATSDANAIVELAPFVRSAEQEGA